MIKLTMLHVQDTIVLYNYNKNKQQLSLQYLHKLDKKQKYTSCLRYIAILLRLNWFEC